MLRKVLMVLLFSLLGTYMVRAQKSVGNVVIDFILSQVDELTKPAEDEFVFYGIQCEIEIRFDKVKNELVFSYRFYDEKVFDAFDLEVGKKGSIQGMILGAMKEDETGGGLEWFVGEFKKSKTNIRYEITYIENGLVLHRKETVVTPNEIEKIASLIY